MYVVDRVEPVLQSNRLTDFFCRFDPLEETFSSFLFFNHCYSYLCGLVEDGDSFIF